MIVTMEMYEEIRAYHNQGRSIRWIAKRMRISRQTVKKYCKGETIPGVRKEYHRESDVVTEDVKSFIEECFKSDEEEGLKKQQHTAKRIYDRLVEEKGFEGGESTIRKAVAELKDQNKIIAKASIPLAYDPGDAIQIDWGEATVYIAGVKTKVNTFCGRLCYSCDLFVQAFYSQNIESFLEAIQRMFEYFGGVPRRLVFDNAKVAVKEGFGLHARATDKYALFSAHYSFKPEFCNIASGNEKGLVQNLVGFSRRNALVPVPRVTDIDELNDMLLSRCIKYRNKHRISSHQQPVKAEYEIEKTFLQKIPPYKYDTSHTCMAKVNDFSLVRFVNNNYSVPCRCIGKTITVKGYANKVLIYSSGKIVAEHTRLFGNGKTTYKLEHYIDQIERKPRCAFQAKPVRDLLTDELITWGKQLPGGNHEMVKLLRLCVDYGEDRILELKRSFPPEVIPTVENIRSLLHINIRQQDKVDFPCDVKVIVTDISIFDEKCGVMV